MMKKERSYQRSLGFTLIELIIVITLIVILSGALLPVINTSRQEAKRAKVSAELDAIRAAAFVLHSDTDEWPPEAATGAGLIDNSTSISDWIGPYLDEWKNDPWGNVYRIYDPASGTSGDRWAQSYGPDGTNDNCGDDDICVRITSRD